MEALSTQEGPRLYPLPTPRWAPALAASGGAGSRPGTWLGRGQFQAVPGTSEGGARFIYLGSRGGEGCEQVRGHGGGGGHGWGEGRAGAGLQAERHREWALWAGWAHAAPRSLSVLGGCRPRRTREDPTGPSPGSPGQGSRGWPGSVDRPLQVGLGTLSHTLWVRGSPHPAPPGLWLPARLGPGGVQRLPGPWTTEGRFSCISLTFLVLEEPVLSLARPEGHL